jgi:hypothetical protein
MPPQQDDALLDLGCDTADFRAHDGSPRWLGAVGGWR